MSEVSLAEKALKEGLRAYAFWVRSLTGFPSKPTFKDEFEPFVSLAYEALGEVAADAAYEEGVTDWKAFVAKLKAEHEPESAYWADKGKHVNGTTQARAPRPTGDGEGEG